MEKKKVALLFICLNPNYWQYAKVAIEGARKFFLLNHQVDFFLWSDMPPETNYGSTVFETEPVEWPLPTLMRYHLFMQQEEKLKEYDYIFYLDIDMIFCAEIKEEIMGEDLTAAQHPMYAFRPNFYPPYEPNPSSSAYIRLPGRIVEENDKPPRFETMYYAGGFQGGKALPFIEAMRTMKKNIDKDLSNNYYARWNDESHWNKYLFDHPPKTILSPSYIYPDSLIDEYYLPLWGRLYEPKIITITKKFTTSKEGGNAVKEQIKDLGKLK